jgi:hypothetical protein
VEVNESLISRDSKVARTASNGNVNNDCARRKVYDGDALRTTVNDKQYLAISGNRDSTDFAKA